MKFKLESEFQTYPKVYSIFLHNSDVMFIFALSNNKHIMELKRHGEINDAEVKYDAPVCCMDSEGNLFPSFSYAARFHNVSPSTASSCWCHKPSFRSKHYKKKVSICVISYDEYLTGDVRQELIELVTRRAAGEHIYATYKNPSNHNDQSLVVKDAIWVNYPFWTGWYNEPGDKQTY